MLKCIIIFGILIIGCHFQNQNIQSHSVDPIVVNPIPAQVVLPNLDHLDPIVVVPNLNVDVKATNINTDQKTPQQIKVSTTQTQTPPTQNLQHTQPAQVVPEGTQQNNPQNNQVKQAASQVTTETTPLTNPQQNNQVTTQSTKAAQPTVQPTIQSIPQAAPQSQQQKKRHAQQQHQLAQALALQAQHKAQAQRKARSQKQLQQLRQNRLNQALSRTQDRKQQEKLKFKEQQLQAEVGVKFVEHVFELEAGYSEFYIKIPAIQQVAINFYSYIAQDNTYIRVKNIDDQAPVEVFIYQNNQKVIYHGDFHFQLYLTFIGNKDGMYMIRLFNSGRAKLISMNTKKLVQHSHIQKSLNTHQAGVHADRTQIIALDINRWFQQFRKVRMLDFQDLKVVENHISKYYSFEIFQTFVCVVVSIIQIQMIQKMLTGDSIV